MENNPTPYASQAQMDFITRKYTLERSIKGNLNWFYWIGGMSILNSIIAATNGGVSFVTGLGITQVIDAVMSALAEGLGRGGYIVQVFGWMMDLVIAGFFIIEGALARKKIKWLIITGLVLYGLDTIILLLFKDWYSALFHGLGLWGIFTGMKQMKQLDALIAAGPPPAPVSTPMAYGDFTRGYQEVPVNPSAPVVPAVPVVPAIQPDRQGEPNFFFKSAVIIFTVFIMAVVLIFLFVK